MTIQSRMEDARERMDSVGCAICPGCGHSVVMRDGRGKCPRCGTYLDRPEWRDRST